LQHLVAHKKNSAEQTMAEYKHQEQDLQAGLQHLANRKQEASATPVALVHQHQVALVHQHQVALVAIQDLERQRLDLLIQHPAGEQPQSQQGQQS
jgi:hypothetical protein